MSFGLYVHIPYCLQKCHYCDFTTFSMDHRIGMSDYTELLLSELRDRHLDIPYKEIRSIYFGGGTPSLLPTEDILTLLSELDNLGFHKVDNLEVSLEINPGTIDQERLDLYLSAGINRFSLGVQTFDDKLLKASGREHSAADSISSLSLLEKNNVNYTLDLLFGQPNQSVEMLINDLEKLKQFNPPHVSAYNLTVPESHPMNQNRAPDIEQAKMFELIESHLLQLGLHRYEISNYAVPGYESQHNLTYWNDLPYWGIGVSAHSYFPKLGKGNFGIRFWNSPSAGLYEKSLKPKAQSEAFWHSLNSNQVEELKAHEAMTDYCHTQLRKISGFHMSQIEYKFGAELADIIARRVTSAVNAGLLHKSPTGQVQLSDKGRRLANLSFLEFTFLPEDLIS